VSVYGYYGRFFTPYSFENVAPGAAACINPNVSATGGGPALTAVQCTGGSPNATGSGFDLKAQRDSDYEIGGSIGIGSTGRLGLRAMQKNATHSIDDVQVGLTNLHQDINYAVGRITVYAAAYQQSLSNHGRFSLNLSRTRAEAKDCETQLLAACVGQAPGFIPDDHDQTWDGTASLIRNDARGGWYSLDAEYGSGLSTAPSDNTVNTTYQAPVLNPYCPAPVGGVGNDNCKVPPHLTFDGEKGFQLQPGLTLAAGMTNLFNDRYWITYLNAQGFHTAQGRTVYVKLSLTK
jgi:outer membrane receptor protein involved in Fe transport